MTGAARGQRGRAVTVAVAMLLMFAGCASTEEGEQRARETEEEIAQILSQPLEAEEYVEAQRCLSPHEFKNIEILDDQRILFEGRGDQYWLNTLRMRCPDLRRGDVLRVRTLSAIGRICDMDSFEVGDWFDWPWYRSPRWPWYGNTGIKCTLGKFQPVTPSQVESIKAALKAR